MPASLRSRARVVLVIALAAVLLVLAFRGVDPGQMLARLRNAHLGPLALGWLGYTASTFMRALRWRVLVGAAADVSPITMFWATALGYLGNNVLPARAGEILRSVALGRQAKVGTTYVLATALTERVLDAVALVVFALVALSSFENLPPEILAAARFTAILALAGVVVLVVLSRLRGRVLAVLGRVPERYRARVLDLADRFLIGLGAFQQPRRALAFAGLTVVVWLLDSLAAVAIGWSLDMSMSLAQALLLLAALGLSSAAPSTPGFVGIYQFVARAVMPAFGFSAEEALTYVIVLQATILAVVGVWGSIGAWRLGMSGLSTTPEPGAQS